MGGAAGRHKLQERITTDGPPSPDVPPPVMACTYRVSSVVGH